MRMLSFGRQPRSAESLCTRTLRSVFKRYTKDTHSIDFIYQISLTLHVSFKAACLIELYKRDTGLLQVNVDVYRQLQGVRAEPITGSDSFFWVSWKKFDTLDHLSSIFLCILEANALLGKDEDELGCSNTACCLVLSQIFFRKAC